MEFFDKLGKKASEAYKITANKTEKVAKETKLKLKISELKSQISDLYEEIGKKAYEKHIREDGKQELEQEIENFCVKIDVLSDEIEAKLQECLDLKDKKQCLKCHTNLEKEDKFCHECGEKQEKNEEPAKEIEIIENEEKTKDDTLEKTVEVESDPKIEENIEHIEFEEDDEE